MPTNEAFEFDSIPKAVEAFARGEFLVVVDNEDRENEGDLIASAAHMTPEKMAFMVRHTSGVICTPMKPERLEALKLPLMVRENEDTHKTAFTITTDYRHGTTTGISAHDRSVTVRAMADPSCVASDFHRPGHLFPLRYTPGGVCVRGGHTEAAIDLCDLANLYPVGVLCELVNEDGSMSRRDDCRAFAQKHGMCMISITDLAIYRKRMGNGDTTAL
ncbi:3,4-dihydroxy-2-butanone 4-phosphate synthase [Piptocephalis cylindrospora]|uniref:3,4-dihydroxy-2-butanone 4-phosphate synthase n=1 Tax=Piptocephalis cylindrospora TaxID=1907219 RepID=A0A4P9Y3Y3_9FUNG|nr:3,4-dihydroxy-2-butanone 4-phosphate synthase [Piptocephalis cylindrospora]|eukprot:RKP13678.1 3,4-dihydroxy-2-butanone 4-phosphate synthase [Piptocephalis cylindrospora]